MRRYFIILIFFFSAIFTANAQTKKPAPQKNTAAASKTAKPSKSETIKYIQDICKKTKGLNYTNTSGNSYSLNESYFYEKDNLYTISFFDRALQGYYRGSESNIYSLIDLTLLDKIELSPYQRYDSPVKFLHVYLTTKSISVNEKEASNYFPIPFVYTEETQTKLTKAILHLHEIEKQNKPKDIFDN